MMPEPLADPALWRRLEPIRSFSKLRRDRRWQAVAARLEAMR